MDLADPQQWNGYAYANNSPVTVSDPDGLREKETTDKTGGGGTPLTGCHGANMSPSCRNRGPRPGNRRAAAGHARRPHPTLDPHFEQIHRAYNEYIAGTSIDPSRV